MVEEHRYRSAACPIDEELLKICSDLVRHAQASAIDQTWPVDWPILANLRREAEEARAAGQLRGALRCLGEAVALLGTAGRVHRRDSGAANAS